MRCLLPLLVLASLAIGGHAQPVTQKEALDLIFKSMGARQRFGEALEAIRAMGVASVGPLVSQWRGQGAGPASGLLTPPWQRGVQRAMDDGMATLVETVRKLIEQAAEPLKIEFVSLDRSNPLVNVAGYVKDASISQLSTFDVQDLSVDLYSVSATLKVNFEKLDGHGLYNVDATASQQLHIFGDGRFDVRVYEPSVEVDVKLGYDDEHFSLDDLQIYIKMDKLKVVMSNFLGGGEVGELVCGIISDVGPAFLEEYREEVNKLISSELKETANALLAKLPIDTIIDWIASGGVLSDGGGNSN